MTGILGIDYGTTGFKVSLFDTHGLPMAKAVGELALQYPAPGWVEQEARDGWEAVCHAIRRTVRQADMRPADILAISATGTSNLSVLDEAGRILQPAMLYGDTRLPPDVVTQQIVCELGEARVAAAFGFASLDEAKLKVILRILRSAKLLWLRANEPDVYARIHACVATSMDLVTTRLTGKIVHLAGGIPLDDDIAEPCGIPRWWFGEPCRTGEIAGHVSAAAAAETGLAEGTPVVMAAGDSLCSFMGAGLLQPGMALNLAGTTDVVAVVAGERPRNPVGYPVEHLIPALWLLSLSPLRGPTMRWLRDAILPAGATFGEIDLLAEQAPPGAQGLLCLPYLSGEKGVVHDLDARGILIGLDVRHDRPHIARAMLEGIAYGLREILEAYAAGGQAIDTIRLSGGGARISLWNQMKADVLRQPVHVLQVLETGCLGAAMLAAVVLGLYRDRHQAATAMTRVSKTFQPDAARSEIYERSYSLYRQLYPANRDLLARLAALRKRTN